MGGNLPTSLNEVNIDEFFWTTNLSKLLHKGMYVKFERKQYCDHQTVDGLMNMHSYMKFQETTPIVFWGPESVLISYSRM